MGTFAKLLGLSVVGITIVSYTVGTAWLPYHSFDSQGQLVVDSEIYDNFPYFQDIRDSNGEAYDYEFDMNYNFKAFGGSVIPSISNFLDLVSQVFSAAQGFLNILLPTYGTNNFCGSFGEERFLSWSGAMEPPWEGWQLFRLMDSQYSNLFTRMTHDERVWLGSLNLSEYQKFNNVGRQFPINEEIYLGISQFAINTRTTTYERCVAYVLAL